MFRIEKEAVDRNVAFFGNIAMVLINDASKTIVQLEQNYI